MWRNRDRIASPDATFRFAGEQFDPRARDTAGGICYLRGRYYDPTIGRFLTRDPLPGSTLTPSFPEGLNAYPYVQNNPVNRVDPTGLLNEGAEIFDCQAGLLFGAMAMFALAYLAIGLGGGILIPYGATLILAETATWASLVEGLELLIAGGVVTSGGGIAGIWGFLTLLDACTGEDSRHGVTS